MKTTHIFILILLLLAACKGNNPVFTLNGNVKGIKAGTAYVIIPDTAFSRIDTITIKDEQFTYELKTDTTTQLILVFPGKKSCVVFADKNTETQLTADTSSWERLTLKGGTENDLLQQFNDSTRNFTPAQIKLAIKDYIRKHPFSPAGVYLLDKHLLKASNPDYEDIKEDIELMSGRLQDNMLIQDIQKQLDIVVKTDSGKYISSFRTKDKNGKNVYPYQYSGKHLVVTFWASWHPESYKLQKEILKLQEKKKKENVTFINVSLDTDKKRWNDIQKRDSLPDIQTCDFEGWESQVVEKFGVTRIPEIILLNAQRKLIIRSDKLQDVAAQLDSLLLKDKEREKLKR